MFEMDEARLNLEIIQKFDDKCIKILDTASAVHLYDFDRVNSVWIQTTIGGVLFVYQRSQPPKYAFSILNRGNVKNSLRQAVNQELLVEIQSPYIMYNTTKLIHNIWFNSNEDCSRIGALLKKLQESAMDKGSLPLTGFEPSNPTKPPSPNNLPMPFAKASAAGDQGATNLSIQDMLTMARDNYNRTSSFNGKDEERPSGNATSKPNYPSVLDSLKALNKETEERSTGKCDLFVSELEQDLLQSCSIGTVGKSTTSQLHQDNAILKITETVSTHHTQGQPAFATTPSSIRAGKSSSHHPQHTKKTPPKKPHKPDSAVTAAGDVDTGYLEDTEGDGDEDAAAPVTPQAAAAPNRILLESLRKSAAAHQEQQLQKPPTASGLSKDQLKAAILHLIENDEGFLATVHNAYAASLNKRLGL